MPYEADTRPVMEPWLRAGGLGQRLEADGCRAGTRATSVPGYPLASFISRTRKQHHMSALVIKAWKAESKPIDDKNNYVSITGRDAVTGPFRLLPAARLELDGRLRGDRLRPAGHCQWQRRRRLHQLCTGDIGLAELQRADRGG